MPDPIHWQVGDSRVMTHEFTHQELETFAKLTGDTNPLHVDAGFGKRGPAGGQVVHGMLAASFVSTLIGVHIPGHGALWTSFQINWRKMIRIGDTLRFEARVSAVQAATRTLDLVISGVNDASGEVYLDGKARVMMIGERQEIRPSDLTGKRVLVTGASGEIGGAICRALAAVGCRLVMWGRNPERLQQLAESLGEQAATFHAVDLQDDQQIEAGLAQSMNEGGIDGFVHAAAAPLNFVEVGDPLNQGYLRAHWQVEVAAFQRIAQNVVAGMQPGGFIITVLPQAVLDAPPPKMSSYVAAKMGAWGLVRAMATELGPKGIRCNAVSPGLVETPYVKDVSVRAKQVEAAGNPMRRLCHVEDVANAVQFLAGPQSAYINGVNLPVTGGARMP